MQKKVENELKEVRNGVAVAENGDLNNFDEVKEEKIDIAITDNGEKFGRSCRKTDVNYFEEENIDSSNGIIEQLSSSRSCKKTDSYQFETDIDIKTNKNISEVCYTPSSRNCKKKDSYEFDDEDFS